MEPPPRASAGTLDTEAGARRPPLGRRVEPPGVPRAAAPVLLAATLVVLGFSSGGFAARTQAIAAIAYAGLTAVVAALGPRRVERLRGPLLLAAVALWAFAGWTLLSGSWSGSASRAELEFVRAFLYATTLVLFGLLTPRRRAVADLLAAVAVAGLVLCVASLMTRLGPDMFAFGVDQRNYGRLQYPVRYASTLGLIAAIGAVVSLSFSADPRRSTAVKVLGAAVTPIFATTLLLSYSRGPVAGGAVALAVLLLAGLSTAAPGALLATAAPTAVATYVAYQAERLATDDFTSARAISQGHRTAVALGLCVVLAAGLRAATTVLDRRVALIVRARYARRPRRRLGAGRLAAGVVLATAALAAIVVAMDLPGLEHGYASFGVPGTSQANTRAHLTEVGSGDRVQAWTVALADFRAAPVIGRGAGTFVLSWARHRPYEIPFNETHSLYFQMLGELGIVGLGLLLVTLGTIIATIAISARDHHRSVFAAGLAAVVTWMVAVAVDWHWQMPVGTLWVFALGGAALAACGEARAAAPHARWRAGRWLLVLVVAATAVLPARVAVAEGHLDKALVAFRGRDFDTAASAAEAARRALGALPAPLMLLGYCAAVRGDSALAVRYEQQAIKRDPDNWTYRYALATVSASAGIDPRPAARAALRLNPLEPLTQAMAHLLGGGDPKAWERRVASLPLVLPGPFD